MRQQYLIEVGEIHRSHFVKFVTLYQRFLSLDIYSQGCLSQWNQSEWTTTQIISQPKKTQRQCCEVTIATE